MTVAKRTPLAGAAAPRPNRPLDDLQPFRQGRSEIEGIAAPIKLSANESHLGPSPLALEAYHDAAAELACYPDGSQYALRTAIAAVHGLDAERIVCGNGSDELLQLLIRAYVQPGDDVVFSRYSFAMAMIHARAQGAHLLIADEPQLRPDAEQLLAAVTPRTRMVFLASPNNPVGQYIPRAELLELHRRLPPDVVLIVDGAYAEYVGADDYDPGTAVVNAGTNAVMTRTFSKLYGLAGARIGWCYAPGNVVDAIQRIRTPFNATGPSMAAAAAAVRDVAYAAYVRDYNRRELDAIAVRVAALLPGVEFVPSAANFYLLRFVAPTLSPEAACAALERSGIIPRPVAAGGPARCLRITVGLTHENDAVLHVLQEYVARATAE